MSSSPQEPGKSGKGRPTQGKRLSAEEASQVAFDIEFFEQVLERLPNWVDVLRCQSQLLAFKGQRQRAVELDRRLVALRPADAVARYNLACGLIQTGDHAAGIEELGRALAAGFRDLEFLENDADLDPVRHDPRFLAVCHAFSDR